MWDWRESDAKNAVESENQYSALLDYESQSYAAYFSLVKIQFG